MPGIFADVERADRIHVEAQDVDGKPLSFDADGLLAVCIQHEMDHLIGKLFVDYLSPLKRELVRKKLEKQRRHARPSPRRPSPFSAPRCQPMESRLRLVFAGTPDFARAVPRGVPARAGRCRRRLHPARSSRRPRPQAASRVRSSSARLARGDRGRTARNAQGSAKRSARLADYAAGSVWSSSPTA